MEIFISYFFFARWPKIGCDIVVVAPNIMLHIIQLRISPRKKYGRAAAGGANVSR